MNEVVIRKMKDCDEDYRLLVKWYHTPQVKEYFHPQIKNLKQAKEKYQPRIIGKVPIIPYIVETDGKPIGYVQTQPIIEGFEKYNVYDYKNPFMIDLFIGESEFLRKGFGTKILNKIIALLFEQNVDVIVLETMRKNEKALCCYEKCKAKRIKSFYDEEYKDEICILHITKQ